MKQKNAFNMESLWPNLDRWEIPKDRVVLNRKLGEGAFGTVYGGEALIEDIWVPVAVKTLKQGSNIEEKVGCTFCHSSAMWNKVFKCLNVVGATIQQSRADH